MISDDPKFEVGDLVLFRDDYMGDMVDGLGIIVTGPKLMFSHDWQEHKGYPNNFWAYDIKIGNELFKMIPEEFLRGLGNEA